MPTLDALQEPTERPLSSSGAGSWMRALLSVDGTNKQIRFSSHSLKATCLSYAAERGCSFEDRLSLGYRTHSWKMALVYSRNGTSRQMRVLECMLKENRDKRFNTNDTRSGRLGSLPNLDGGRPAETLLDPVGSAERVHMTNHMTWQQKSELKIQDFDEFVLSDHATTGSETETDVETTVRPKVSYCDIVSPEGAVLHQRCKGKTLLLMKNENRVVLLCSRETGNMYKVTQNASCLLIPVSVSAQSLTETEGQKGLGMSLQFRCRDIRILCSVTILFSVMSHAVFRYMKITMFMIVMFHAFRPERLRIQF